MGLLDHLAVVEDERERCRLSCNAEVQVETLDHRIVQGQMRDIGLQSLYLYTDENSDDFLIYGEQVRVRVTMHRDGSDLSVEMEGNVGRMDEQGFVVRFDHSLKWWPVFTMFPESKRHACPN